MGARVREQDVVGGYASNPITLSELNITTGDGTQITAETIPYTHGGSTIKVIVDALTGGGSWAIAASSGVGVSSLIYTLSSRFDITTFVVSGNPILPLVFFNGQLLKAGVDYILSDNGTYTVLTALYYFESGKQIIVVGKSHA